MKASLKLREERHNPLLKAKVPVTVLGLPFVSGVTAGDPSDLSFNIRTSSDAGPSLSFAYKPNDRFNPFALTLKSGVGVLGSPDSSPLILAAHFSLVGRANPSFSVQFRPRFGNFSLKRTALSSSLMCPSPAPPVSDPFNEKGWNSAALADLKSASRFFSGVSVSANTELPVTKMAAVRFRWGVNFPADLGKQLPFLTVEKVSIGRVEEAKPRSTNGSPVKGWNDVEVLKGTCAWMGREVDALRRENQFIKESIEDLKSRVSVRYEREVAVPAKKPPVVGASSGFDSWRKKKNVSGDAIQATPSLIGATASDVEAELKKAIKAASSP